MTGRSVLVVRHGFGRGRMDDYMELVVEELRRRRRRQGGGSPVRVHDTGNPLPSLDEVTAVVFWLADPLKEWYPDCFAEATAIAADARSRGLRIVNPPEALSNTVKSRQAMLWRKAGFDTPGWIPFADAGALRSAAEGMEFPFIVRADEAHAQESMAVVGDEHELAALDPGDFAFPGVVAPVCDVRAGYAERDPESIYARLHHKKRAYVLDDRVLAEHVFFSDGPIVSADTYTFGRYWRVPRALQGLVPLPELDRIAIREDVAYWRNGEPQAETLLSATRALGLSFAAVDYSEQADGRLMLWEANPHPYLPVRWSMLKRQRHGAERLVSYRRAIGDFLLRLAEPND